MKKLSGLFLLVILLNVCSSYGQAAAHSNATTTNNSLSDKEKKEGWQLLFDGQTTNGWHTYNKQNVGSAWKVQDGAICLEARGEGNQNREGGDLVTNQEYSNFHLMLDWKIAPKGNSGIIIYAQESPQYRETWNTGMEVQVLDNGTPTTPGHSDAKIYTHRAGDLYDLLASKEAAKPAGEWNHVEIRSLNGKLDFYMNGEHTLSTTMWDENWKKMIAISKFKDMPGFGTFKSGKIALQDHGDNVCFRNIKIKKL
ncbi:MAG: DUF1080 domain-containing protein [Flavisolibacter sp.]|nr:DUF1080 domain-containing protein [Flavisolibacter sp.]MBD0376811.1 DUF1080 domain-containing protein [Flavisolibacter sp.]